MKVDCHLCTFGRFETVRKSVAQFLAQDYPDKSLLIFNTAVKEIVLDEELEGRGIRVVNKQTNSDGSPFSSLGQVRQGAISYGEGDAWICWDDDDLFLPYHISQSVLRWLRSRTLGWKPKHSLFSGDGGKTFKFAGNSMEASVLVDLPFVREHGFSTTKSGGEHVFGGWMDKLREQNQLTIEEIRPSYAYVWGDGLSKTSGNIDAPDNFENHKENSQDFGDGPLKPVEYKEIEPMIKRAALATLDGKVPA